MTFSLQPLFLDIMKEFCKEKNLSFPVPKNREDDFIWIYGLVYDKCTSGK